MAEVRVLVPVDGSAATLTAIERGLPRVGHPARVTLMVVMDRKILDMPEEAREHLEWDDEDEIFLREDEANAALDAAAARLPKAKDVRVHREVVKGDVLDAILKASKEHDVVVMHALRRNPREDRKTRSLTEAIARQAACDVLLVRDPGFS